MQTLNGRAVVHGIDGTIAWEGLAEGSAQLPQEAQLSDQFKTDELVLNGKTISVAADERMEDLSLTVIPCAGTGEDENTLDNAKAACAKPAPMAVVTLSDMNVDDYNGDYNYMGGEITVNEGYVKQTMKLRRYNGAALAPVDS